MMQNKRVFLPPYWVTTSIWSMKFGTAVAQHDNLGEFNTSFHSMILF